MVLLSKWTPFGKPLTWFVTAWPLLSVASIVIESIAVFTSLVWFSIAVTVGCVVSVTVITVADDLFNPLSVAIIDIVSLPVKTKSLGIDTEKFPVLSVVPVNSLPSLKFNVILVLGSDVPLTVVSWVVMLLALGVAGATLSIISI